MSSLRNAVKRKEHRERQQPCGPCLVMIDGSHTDSMRHTMLHQELGIQNLSAKAGTSREKEGLPATSR
jgi:hypothetical protein